MESGKALDKKRWMEGGEVAGKKEESDPSAELVKELDAMEVSVSSSEEEFLEKLRKLFASKKPLTHSDEERLGKIHKKYLGEKSESDEEPEAGSDEEEIDDDDFV